MPGRITNRHRLANGVRKRVIDFSFRMIYLRLNCVLYFVFTSETRAHGTSYYSTWKRYGAWIGTHIDCSASLCENKRSQSRDLFCYQKHISQLINSQFVCSDSAIYFLQAIAHIFNRMRFVQICTQFRNQLVSNSKMESMFCVAFPFYQSFQLFFIYSWNDFLNVVDWIDRIRGSNPSLHTYNIQNTISLWIVGFLHIPVVGSTPWWLVSWLVLRCFNAKIPFLVSIKLKANRSFESCYIKCCTQSFNIRLAGDVATCHLPLATVVI